MIADRSKNGGVPADGCFVWETRSFGASEFMTTDRPRRTNLPVQTTALIGRTEEVAHGCRLLRAPAPRLLTLTGTGGVGKTRLSIEIAASLVGEFKDGVCWVPLAGVADAAGVVPAIARTLGVGDETSAPLLDRVSEHLRDRETLLVLDNFEHVIGAAPTLQTLLSGASRLKMLVSSRTLLRLNGEHEFAVEPLASPREQLTSHGRSRVYERTEDSLRTLMEYPSVALFVARAQTADARWTLTDDNAHTVAAICARLDGLPLAIELAAARTRLLSPQELLERLHHRLALLTGGARDALPHHQTLRRTIDWSYDLLEPNERRLFGRLAVFAGGWTIDAAEQVCGDDQTDVLDGLQRLLDDSLIQHDRTPHDRATTRLLMLDTLREYALERLEQQDELAALREQHARYFAARAEETRALLAQGGAEQAAHLERWDADDDNLQAALAWSRDAAGDATLFLRLAGSLWRYWELRGRFTEGRQWLDAALTASETVLPTEDRARVLDGAGILADYQGDYSRAEALYQRSLDTWRALGNQRGVARALNGLGGMAAVRGDAVEARRLYEQSLALRRALGDRADEATTLNNLALVAFDQEQFAEAQRYFEQSLQIARSIGDERGVARGLANVGLAAMYRGDPAEAEHLLEASLAMYRTLGEPSAIAHILGNLGKVALSGGNMGRAFDLYVESLDLFATIEDRNGIAESLEGLASEAEGRGATERAVRLWAAADTLRSSIDAPLPPAERASYEASIATARETLGDARFTFTWDEGQHRPLATTIAWAREAQAEASSTAHKSIPAGLSEREIDVLRLVARGLSAKQVAAQLIISPRTVHAHLASIYGKIGVSTRVAATHFAIEHGLLDK
jgi:predicted ATPase/DNA-binding CsgD family transcriptional regulator